MTERQDTEQRQPRRAHVGGGGGRTAGRRRRGLTETDEGQGRTRFGVDRHFCRAVGLLCRFWIQRVDAFLFFPPMMMIIIIIIIVIDLCSFENLLLKKEFSFDQNYIVSLLTISRRRQEPEAPVLKCTSISAEDRFVKPSFSPYNIYSYILRTGCPKNI